MSFGAYSVLFLTLILWQCGPLTGYQVKIYKDLNYRGLIYDHESLDQNCHDVEDYAKGEAGSVRSNTCLMVYEQAGCTGHSFKLAQDTPEVASLSRSISSFQPCNEIHGGDKIHVKMFNSGGQTIADYQNICSCQDLPSQVTTQLESLDNHGNCVKVYSTATCSGDSAEIPAGRNGMADVLPNLGWYVRSVSGCGNRRGCVKLSASIFKFVINPDEEIARQGLMADSSQELDLATKTTFYNNGSATVYQIYEATSKVRESSTIEISKTITSMESHKVENSTSKSWGVKISFPGVFEAGVNVANGLEKGYTTETTESETETNTYTHEEINEFTVRQIIAVPPCTEYQVSAMVQMTENLPVIYEVHSKVTGESSGIKMTGEEVRGYVDGMTFVEMLDEYTAVFKSTHSAVASVGVEATVSGGGSPIQWCGRGE